MKRKILFAVVLFIGLLGFISCNDTNDLNSVSAIKNIEGNWNCVLDEGDGTTEYYKVTITADPNNANGIIISNFFNNGASAHATVNQLHIDLPKQQLGDYTVEGSGNISSDYQRIEWDYTVDGSAVHATFTPGGVAKKAPIL